MTILAVPEGGKREAEDGGRGGWMGPPGWIPRVVGWWKGGMSSWATHNVSDHETCEQTLWCCNGVVLALVAPPGFQDRT